eukprot:Gregarina_sp_Poly_1__216@NODE_104_length_14336_cov_169_911977_g91_i0_p5_GENE_NODE_104_length_14336_cov_169_911977_g91_i0NODE_104_length_14336_cov_169_911977_g91_i0_p5_ORF_typecomplete_len363_score41_54GNAT_acetyltr_2/PF13718_6/2_8e36tRNA_bind_2/PF13725_6/6_2e26HTH_40/PF14493_6/0_12Cullin_binding/PF03556_15/4_8e03Cullin_binding/PF03556_15/0_17DUF1647/PF07801_11/76DUF1647/PF07801_11/8_6_NODE_104_length_14336_cov_169_911977_g91_i01146412552
MMSDSSVHHLYVLTSDGSTEILCAAQVAYEGGFDSTAAEMSLGRGCSSAGDLVPHKLIEISRDVKFAGLVGARIVRIASRHQRRGVGSVFVRKLQHALFQKPHFQDVPVPSTDWTGSSNNESWKQLLTWVAHEPDGETELLRPDIYAPYKIDYFSTSFGLSADLLKFWSRLGFRCIFVSAQRQDQTGEFSAIFTYEADERILAPFYDSCLVSFSSLLGDAFRAMAISLAVQFIDHLLKNKREREACLCELHSWQISRMEAYVRHQAERSIIRDLWPAMAHQYLSTQSPSLSPLQQIIVIGLGLQRKSVDAISRDLNCAPAQILGHLEKVVSKFIICFKNKAASKRQPSPKPNVTAKKFKNLA